MTEQAEQALQGDSTREESQNVGNPPRHWLAEVFHDLEEPLLRYVTRLLGADSAQDVVQEVFVKLCQQPWPSIRSHFKAWLYKACRNRVIDIRRREGNMKIVHSESSLSAIPDEQQIAPDQSAEHSDEIATVRTKLEALPDRQQELLRLRLQEGLSYKQIAEVTGLSTSNVGYLLHQAISNLRGSLQVS